MESQDDLDLELDRLHFLPKNTRRTNWSKAYAKELRSDILSCQAFIGRQERAIKRLRRSLAIRHAEV